MHEIYHSHYIITIRTQVEKWIIKGDIMDINEKKNLKIEEDMSDEKSYTAYHSVLCAAVWSNGVGGK